MYFCNFCIYIVGEYQNYEGLVDILAGMCLSTARRRYTLLKVNLPDNKIVSIFLGVRKVWLSLFCKGRHAYLRA